MVLELLAQQTDMVVVVEQTVLNLVECMEEVEHIPDMVVGMAVLGRLD
jgi:hypothetical protein